MPIEPAGIASTVTAIGHAVNIVKTLSAALKAMNKAKTSRPLVNLTL